MARTAPAAAAATGENATTSGGDTASIQGALLALGARAGQWLCLRRPPSSPPATRWAARRRSSPASGTLAFTGGATIRADADGGQGNAGQLGSAIGGAISLSASNGALTLGGPLLATADAASHVGVAAAVTDGGGQAQGGNIAVRPVRRDHHRARQRHPPRQRHRQRCSADPMDGLSRRRGRLWRLGSADGLRRARLTVNGDLALAATGRGGEPSGGNFAARAARAALPSRSTIRTAAPARMAVAGDVSLDASGLAAAADGISHAG